jgi:hypothetical protein
VAGKAGPQARCATSTGESAQSIKEGEAPGLITKQLQKIQHGKRYG